MLFQRLAICVSVGVVGGCYDTQVASDDPKLTDVSTSRDELSALLPYKVCSGVVPGKWRDTVGPVSFNSWTGCQNWAASINATHWQIGCVDGGGYTWTASLSSSSPPGTNPCNWGSAGATEAHKVCSGVWPGKWRDTITVSFSSTSQCQSWAQAIGASHFQVGCVNNTGHSWSAVNSLAAPSGNSCGW
jgi:hypothetical protein